MKKTVIVLVGPTAVGKTSIAVQVAKVLHRNHKIVRSFLNEFLDLIKQWSCLVFINEVPAHFHDGISAFVVDLICKIHCAKVCIYWKGDKL